MKGFETRWHRKGSQSMAWEGAASNKMFFQNFNGKGLGDDAHFSGRCQWAKPMGHPSAQVWVARLPLRRCASFGSEWLVSLQTFAETSSESKAHFATDVRFPARIDRPPSLMWQRAPQAVLAARPAKIHACL